MRKTGWRFGLTAVLLAWGGWIFVADDSSATLAMQKKAKELGFPVENCLYCHVEKLPKKGAVTYNDRGKWLMAEKDKRKAKEVDVSWLKEYPAEKK
jgi:hypothetical protein